jgi:hypothetical protein
MNGILYRLSKLHGGIIRKVHSYSWHSKVRYIQCFQSQKRSLQPLLDKFMESTLTSSSVEEGLPDIEIGVNVGKSCKIFLQSAWKMHSHLQTHP